MRKIQCWGQLLQRRNEEHVRVLHVLSRDFNCHGSSGTILIIEDLYFVTGSGRTSLAICEYIK